MLHLSSYHSNGMPAVVWSNRVNLIGEKVYKPKIHFCENCNKPILIYGRLIPCKHVFCFTCATLCLNQQSCNTNNPLPATVASPPLPAQIDASQSLIQSPHNNSNSSWTINNHNGSNKNTNHINDKHHQQRHSRTSNSNTSRGQILHQSDSNHSLTHKDNNYLMTIDESTSNTTPTTFHQETINSPNASGSLNVTTTAQQNHSLANKGCHRCGGRALRVERNVLNSIFVCHVDSCKRTYLSARDLQAHVTHRHSRNKSNNGNPSASSASMMAISSSPYISSSSLLHSYTGQSNSHRQTNSNNNVGNSSTTQNNNANSTSTTTGNNITSNTTNTTTLSNNNNNTSTTNNNNSKNSIRSPSNHYHNNRRDRDSHHHHGSLGRERNRAREKDRERYNKEREGYHRDRNTKEHHKQSLQRAAQWAEASAQMLEKGLTR